MSKRGEHLRIYTADLETDPFEYGLVPSAFVVGFYDGEEFIYFWGDDWLERFLEHIWDLEPGIIYFHNGGKFDFHFFLEKFKGNIMIRNGRIMKARMPDFKHQFRDSYAILPFPLRDYKKDDIDINKLKKDVRDGNRDEIISYLKGDCVYLWELCSAFRDRFGDRITIGGTAMRELQAVHKFETLPLETDKDIRDKYFYGGRVQCFEKGIIKGNLKVYDVNSMYPSVMRNYKHPIGKPIKSTGNKITRYTQFISVIGKNYGAFPVRKKDGGIDFSVTYGEFHVTIHEWKTAIRYGLFEPERITRTVDFERTSTFAEFVDKFFNLRVTAKISGDDILALFYKYILNSAYGKFAQNPDNFVDYEISGIDVAENPGYTLKYEVEGKFKIWYKPSDNKERGVYNVATGCSITGAARSVILEAIANAKRPVYCDTDSMICEELSNVKLDDKELGAWKYEGGGHEIAIGGKKLYALFGSVCPDCNSGRRYKTPSKTGSRKCRHHFHRDGCTKQANKGVRISPEEIRRVAQGEEVTYIREAPSFKISGNHQFVKRRVNLR